jgi:hypothetical protein
MSNNEVIEVPHNAIMETRKFSVAEVRQHVNAVQEVMKAVMKADVHYGTIPGTPKPTLYKAGAEVLCMTFRIADDYEIEDLSTPDMVRYRVKCIGKHQVTAMVLGQGMGEASSGEEKYKWRSSVCVEEFEETPIHLRRKKYGKKKGGGFYSATQVRTEPSDLANTVLKMACKRAKIAMTLNVTAASDMFTQDIEDLPEELRGEDESQVPQSDPALIEKWIDAANAAPDEATLKAIWKEGVQEFKNANDVNGANLFKKTVTDRGISLKAAAEKAAKDMTKEAPKHALAIDESDIPF